MQSTPSSTATTLKIVPWIDPIVDEKGFPVHDPYIEMFWLPVLGPTATWLYRRMVSGVLTEPSGFIVNMDELARGIGVAYTSGRHNPFARALHRCIMFGAAQQVATHPEQTVAVRRSLPLLPHRHLSRLPEPLQVAHHDWIHVPTAS
jgi:hypothetical protein